MNIFDNIQDSVFDTITTTFGYQATWIPADGSAQQSAKVLYKDATEKHGMSNIDIDVERYLMEYKAGDFVGLKKSVDQLENEVVRIQIKQQVLEFSVKAVDTKFDGKTLVAILTPPKIVS